MSTGLFLSPVQRALWISRLIAFRVRKPDAHAQLQETMRVYVDMGVPPDDILAKIICYSTRNEL